MHADALEFIVTVLSGAEDSLDEPADGGATALHYAVSGGHEECVRVLLQYGADINSITTTEEVRREGKGERRRGKMGEGWWREREGEREKEKERLREGEGREREGGRGERKEEGSE